MLTGLTNSLMKMIMHTLMLSCKKATFLIEKRFLTDLSLKEILQLNMHTSMCRACLRYKKQSLIIDKLLQKHIQISDPGTAPLIKNEPLKEKIINSLL